MQFTVKHRFELPQSTYKRVFFNSEYAAVLHGPCLDESMDAEELWMQKVQYKTYVH